jgi:hypothetical protein
LFGLNTLKKDYNKHATNIKTNKNIYDIKNNENGDIDVNKSIELVGLLSSNFKMTKEKGNDYTKDVIELNNSSNSKKIINILILI